MVGDDQGRGGPNCWIFQNCRHGMHAYKVWSGSVHVEGKVLTAIVPLWREEAEGRAQRRECPQSDNQLREVRRHLLDEEGSKEEDHGACHSANALL